MSAKVIKRLTIQVPASSANIGPGFDALALALKVYCTVDCELLESDDPQIPLVSLSSDLEKFVPADKNNLVYKLITSHWTGDANLIKNLRLRIKSNIPTGKGLGSSAAATVAAIWAAHAFSTDQVDSNAVLNLAAQTEGHADNVSAALLGGLVTVGHTENKTVAKKIAWPHQWSTIVTVPTRTLCTKESRAALPKQVSHTDAAANIQAVSLLLAAVTSNDEELMKMALIDRLHEPYRMSLVPELALIRKALSELPCIGTVLSGAGPSLLTIVNKKHADQTLQCLEAWAAIQPEPCQIMDLAVDDQGLRCSYA